mgnify:CR=1 FL=1
MTETPKEILSAVKALEKAVKATPEWTMFLMIGRNNMDQETVDFNSTIVTESNEAGEEYLPWPLAVIAQLHGDRNAMERLAEYLDHQNEVRNQLEAEAIAEEVKH